MKNYFNKLSFLNVGDVIWAERYKNEQEKAKIAIGHQEGPFVVIKKTFFSVYVLPCTSNIKNIKAINNFYQLDDKKYHLNKTSYVRLNIWEKMTKNRLIKILTKLDDEDLNLLLKKCYCFGENKQNKIIRNLKYQITSGDLIKYHNQLYYLFKIKDGFYYCHLIHQKTSKNAIKINDTYYAMDFYVAKKIKIKEKITIFDSCEIKDRIKINNLIEEYKNIRNDKTIKRGCLVKDNDNYCYIYGEYQNNFLAYQISLIKENNNQIKVTINKGFYYTDFKEKTIPKSETLKILRMAKEEEIDEIKKLKTNFKTTLKKENKIIFHKKIKPKTIIIDDTETRYLVLKRYNNMIKCVKWDNLDEIIQLELKSHVPYEIIETISDYAYFNIMTKLKNLVKN